VIRLAGRGSYPDVFTPSARTRNLRFGDFSGGERYSGNAMCSDCNDHCLYIMHPHTNDLDFRAFYPSIAIPTSMGGGVLRSIGSFPEIWSQRFLGCGFFVCGLTLTILTRGTTRNSQQQISSTVDMFV
jgi:hypothetical protein